MKIYYSDMELPGNLGKSIFLAGPTPRDDSVKSWRLEAVNILEGWKYDGSVCIPERSSGWAGVDYDEQVEWEHEAMSGVDAIVFWVPRDIKGGMPGFTTNVEFGMHFSDAKTFYGRPEGSDKNRYLDYIYKMAHGDDRKISVNLGQLLSDAVNHADAAESERTRAMESHCCSKMVYAAKNDVIDYVTDAGYSFTYSIIDGDVRYVIKNCPWCGTNLQHHKQDMLSGEYVEHSFYPSFPERMKKKI